MKIDISNPIRYMGNSGQQKSSLERSTLKVGDNLLGRVLEIKNSGKAFIDFGRFRALARIPYPVRENDVISVKVLEERAPIRLGLINPAQKISPQAKKMLSRMVFPSEDTLEKLQSEIKTILNCNNGIFKGRVVPIYVKDILTRISSHFGRMGIGKDSSELSSKLKSYIENSGIFFEKKIESAIIKSFDTNKRASLKELREVPEIKDIIRKDMKPNVSILKDFLDRKGLILRILGTRNLEAIKGTAEKLLAEMVAQQGDTIISHDKQESAHSLVYTLPLEESNQGAKLKVYYSRKNKEQAEAGFKVSVLLAMDKIGRIRTDFFLFDKELSLTFFVNDCSIKEYIEEHSKAIVESLATHFKRLTLSVNISENEIEEFEMEDPGVVNSGIVNLKV